MEEPKTCWICGIIISSGFLCARHRKRYIYNKKHNFVVLKSGRRKISKGQQKLFRIVREVFKKPTFMECVYSWLKYRRYDICVGHNIFEADGRQHKVYVKHFYRSKKKFEEAKRIDKMKDRMAMENGYLVHRFDHKQLEDDEYIKRRVKKIAKC